MLGGRIVEFGMYFSFFGRDALGRGRLVRLDSLA